MADSKGQYQKLPPGWDCKYDQSTGNCYYINYLTRAMQLEDPRISSRYKQLQNERCSTESIPMQPMHGGSPYHVYPTNNLPAMRAFQAGPALNPSIHMSTSPLLSSRGHLELSPIPFLKSSIMQTPRLMANMSRRSTIQETSFTNPFDTDAVVAKIQNMFPTASENHIRLLLKRYYNREAVVISALQVEKHPVTMPGPFVAPPAQRHLFHSNSAFHMTPPARRPDIGAATTSRASSGLGFHSSRTAGPVPGGRFGGVMSMHSGNGSGVRGADGGGGLCYTPLPFHGSPRFGEQWRSSPKPSSPKMKLRYMKNIFPKADEMLLLDILADSDNNVQKASEKLISLGYVKRDFVPHVSHRPNAVEALLLKKAEDEKLIPLRPKEYTQEEKEAMQVRLKEKYTQIAERIILMALESVNYAEDRAIQILQIVLEEDEACARKHAAAIVEHLQTTLEQDETATDGNGNLANNAADKHAQRSSTDEDTERLKQQEFNSLLGRIVTLGHDNKLAKGPDENLLLADYVTWNGANPDISLGHKQLAAGPDAAILSERHYTALGHNPELCKGSKASLAKGSIYARLTASGGTKSANIKCN